MLERFTADARKVVVDAKTKATERGDASVGPLHLLSALTTGDSVAARVLADLGVDTAAVDRELGATPDAELLRSLGIDLDEIRRRAEDRFGEGALQRVPVSPRGPLNRLSRSPFTDEAKRTLVESLKEARAAHCDHLGAEHLLLGILRVADSKPRGRLRTALDTLGIDYPTTRELIQSHQGRASA
ncbi:MAG TPA: Clp protease N-terminal domain-containing protein [Streptosporangiaceae bacterium]|nr:Clp protease N-terminal domain-containing protein [Streptosporangiaceae bacterium]